MNDGSPIGVLLMAYGSPESVADLPGYLADIRGNRPTTGAVLEEISGNYAAIGGRSPLAEQTRRQAEAVGSVLDEDGKGLFRIYVGMRHWSPWIEETVGKMLDDGVTRAISMVLAPHYSRMSVGQYQRKIADGLEMYRGCIDFAHVDSYHDAPGLICALAKRVRDGVSRWPEEARDPVHVIFSAHSLPARILGEDDPYDSQVRQTASLVAARAGIPRDRWSWSYQSAGRSDEPWLGPALPDHLAELAERGVRDVVSVPVGFVCDHVEVLYDIDVAARRVAAELDMRLERPPALNDDPVFIRQLADVIRSRAAERKWV